MANKVRDKVIARTLAYAVNHRGRNIQAVIAHNIHPDDELKDPSLTITSIYEYMVEEGLVRTNNDGFGFKRDKLTKKAIDIAESGGWLKFVADQKEVEGLQKKITHLTIKDLEGSIFQVKYWWALAAISGLAGAILTIVTQLMLKKLGAT